MYYWVEIQDDLIIGTGSVSCEIELVKNQRQIKREIFNNLTSLPAYFDKDKEGNITKITPIKVPPTVEYDLVDSEKLAMAEAIIAHEVEIQQLKAELAALKGE